MIMTRRQADYIERIKNEIPVGVDPFEYILQYLNTLLFPNFFNGALGALLFFLALHIVITLSCLTCLLVSIFPFLRHRGRENQWILKRLYIKDVLGNQVHQTPLYLVNTGVFMSLAQLLGSIAAQVYIWTEYRSFKSPGSGVQARIPPLLASMFTFEFYSFWLMIWCFIVTLLYTEKTYAERLKCRPLCIISPFAINLLMISFPIFTTIASMATINLVTSARTTLNERWQGFQNGLKKGSILWRQLNSILSSDSSEGMQELVKELAELKTQEQSSGRMVTASLEHMIHWLRISQTFWAAVLSLTCLVFIITFWKLIKQLNPRLDPAHETSRRMFSDFYPKPYSSSDHQTTISENLGPTTGGHRFFFPHHQYVYMIVRAFAMITGMLATIVLCIIVVIKSTEIIINPTWRSTAMWLSVVSGTCSAIPVAFQCWKLYFSPRVTPTLRDESTEAVGMDGI